MVNGVDVDVVLTGEYPGDGRERPVSFPDPGECAVRGESFSLVSLPSLVELKIASGMTAPCATSSWSSGPRPGKAIDRRAMRPACGGHRAGLSRYRTPSTSSPSRTTHGVVVLSAVTRGAPSSWAKAM